MSRAKKRADRIRADIPLAHVLADYGYLVHPDGGDREQQFPCDLHGDGRDGTPSARLYPASNSAYCFACGRSRDAIQFAREKEGVDFWGAVKLLEARYHLPPLPWDDDDDVAPPQEESVADRVRQALRPKEPFGDTRERLQRKLTILTHEHEFPMSQVLGYWEVFDRVCYGVDMEAWPESKGSDALHALLTRIQEAEGAE